jgi:hypothetical protein
LYRNSNFYLFMFKVNKEEMSNDSDEEMKVIIAVPVIE